MTHFISIADCTVEELEHLLHVSAILKEQHRATGRNDPILAGKTLAMIFEKPSLRTHVSFDVAMTHLGGRGLFLRDEEVGLERREPAKDVARVLSGMCDGIMARVFEHEKILTLAKYAAIPVINGLSDYSHPCQAMADLLTMREKFGDLTGRTMAFIGDGNNMARSLAIACGKLGIRFIVAFPPGYDLPADDIHRIKSQIPQMNFQTTRTPADAVRQADVIYTDTWVSMGQEADKQRRIRDFAGFAVDEALMAAAPKHAIVMHCLPAYRGLEISDGVMEGKQSVVFEQAANRLHFQKGLLAVLLGNA
ncbi:MAG TPA: ornithine carbamoyltransferase [Tepidisphaeraceae bacterium]|jgi:ornithine carbamoyltransferase|nr:ornithine carbamoyltransferase [Tepidisphaeraceae bacterium]